MTDTDAFDELDAQTRQAIREVVRDELGQDRGTRRDVLKAAGGGTLAALLGAGGVSAVSGRAAADASASDSDGDLGDPTNRFDAFVDGLDANDVRARTTFTDPSGKEITGEVATASQVGSGGSTTLGGLSDVFVGPGEPASPTQDDLWFATETQFDPTFIEERKTSGGSGDASDWFDPLFFHASNFSDGHYRLMTGNNSTGARELEKSADLRNWTTVSSDVFPGFDKSGGQSFQDHFFGPDGRVYLLFNTDPGDTELYRGDSIQSASRVGTVTASYPDGGMIYRDGIIHYYLEQDDAGASTNGIQHLTAPLADPLNTTNQGQVIDVSGRSYQTGDPDIIEINGIYYMFGDWDQTHPNYYISVWRSFDLYNWELIAEQITSVYGGDMCVQPFRRETADLAGFTEYTGSDQSGIGLWEIEVLPRGLYRYDGAAWRPVDPGLLFARDGGGGGVIGSSSGGGGGGGSTNIVEDFESGDIAEYVGDTGSFQIVQSPVEGGTYALQGTSNSSNPRFINDADHSPAPAPGDTFECWTRVADANSNAQLHWATTANTIDFGPEGYMVDLNSSSQILKLNRIDSGDATPTELDSQAVTTSAGVWYRWEISWGTNGHITATLYDGSGTSIGSVTATDTNYGAGGIGFGANSSSGSLSSYWDEVRIL